MIFLMTGICYLGIALMSDEYIYIYILYIYVCVCLYTAASIG